MKFEVGWRKFLWEKYEITPESVYMGVNELKTLLTMRDELGWPDYQVLTYEEYVVSVYRNGLISYTVKKHSFVP